MQIRLYRFLLLSISYPLTKQLSIVLLGRVEKSVLTRSRLMSLHPSPPTPRRCTKDSALSSRQIGLLLHTTLTFISFCYCKTVIHSLCAISGWVRLRSHGALRKIQKKSLIFLSGVF